MKKPWLVVYSSETGNTRKVAEAIFQALPAGSEIHPVETAPSCDNFEKVAMGYWADKGTADYKARKYMQRIADIKVFLFMTLGAYPDSDHAKKVLNNAVALLGDNCQLLGAFVCQGQPAEYLLLRAKSRPADHPRGPTPERLKRWADAAGRPNSEDLANARAAVRKVL